MAKDSRFTWGLSFLALGILFLLKQFGVFPPVVENIIFDLRNIPLALGIIFLIVHQNKTIGLVLLAVGLLFYLKDIILLTRDLSDFIWPILFIAVGAILLSTPKKDVKNNKNETKEIVQKEGDDNPVRG